MTATELGRDRLAVAVDDERTRLASQSPSPAASNGSDDEARAFLQELVHHRVTDLSFWVVPGASSVYLLQWVLCRRGARPQAVLRAIDGTTTTIAALFHAMMVFGTFPGELPGLSYTRMLLLVTSTSRA